MIGEQISVPLEMMTLFIKTLKKLPPLRTSYIGYISLDVPPNPNRWLDLDFEVLRFWSLFKRENLNNFAGFPRPHSKKTVKSATWHQMFLKIEAGGANREIWHQYLLHKKPSQKHLILISKFSSKTATNHLFLHFFNNININEVFHGCYRPTVIEVSSTKNEGGSSTMLCTTLESVNAPPGLKAFTQISVPIPSGFSLKQPEKKNVVSIFCLSWTQGEKKWKTTKQPQTCSKSFYRWLMAVSLWFFESWMMPPWQNHKSRASVSKIFRAPVICSMKLLAIQITRNQ